MDHTTQQEAPGSSLRPFFILTFAISWALWIPVAILKLEGSLGILLIGAFSPSIMGILMVYWREGKTKRAEFWRRLIDFDRIGPIWYIVALLFFPAVMSLTLLIEALLGGFSFSLEAARQTIRDPASLIVFILTMLVGGPLAEELGWRGYALVGLQKKWTALKASLVLGVIHVLWHSPLFFVPGTSQGAIGFGTGLYWLWSAQVIVGAIFYTLVFNNNRQSTLSAVLIHFMSNTTTTLFAQLGGTLPMQTEVIRTVVFVVLGIVMVVVWGPRTLTRHPRINA